MAPTRLLGTAAWKALVGNTITGKTSTGTFSEYFDPAGAVRYVDQDGLSAGTWSVQGDRVCVEFPDDDERSCSIFAVTGSEGTSEEDGNTIRFDVLPGNAKGL